MKNIVKSKNTLHVIADKNLTDVMKMALQERNFELIYTCKAKSLNTCLSSHPDIQIHFLTDTLAVCAPEVFTYYKKRLPSYIDLRKGDKELAVTYPRDCAYNIVRLGEYAIGNLTYMSPLIQELYRSLGVTLIHVNQGYAKCNICVVNEHAMITEDKGIYSRISEIKEIDCLYLKAGEVSLKGFSYGFIGGASGAAKNCIYFCGNLKYFSQREKIYTFLNKHQAEFFELYNAPLQDYGSLIFF